MGDVIDIKTKQVLDDDEEAFVWPLKVFLSEE